MATINSVLGPLDTAELGFTLMHEHLLCGFAGVSENYPQLLGGDFMEKVFDGLTRAKDGGVKTVVDATTLDLGRNVNVMVEAARRTGVNIIACSGWWLDIPPFFEGVSPNQFADLFIREIKQGMCGTEVKAGILKAASDISGMTRGEELVLRGVARAHLETGAPIMLHSYPTGRVGEQQLAVLKGEGVDLRRVKLDHSNDTTDVEYLLWILEQGCYLGLDRYPGRNVSSLARTKTMKALIDAGYAHRLCPSHDCLLARVMADNPVVSEEERLRLNPHGYLYIKKVVFPWLREMGVSASVMDGLCIDGPRNFFEAA